MSVAMEAGGLVGDAFLQLAGIDCDGMRLRLRFSGDGCEFSVAGGAASEAVVHAVGALQPVAAACGAARRVAAFVDASAAPDAGCVRQALGAAAGQSLAQFYGAVAALERSARRAPAATAAQLALRLAAPCAGVAALARVADAVDAAGARGRGGRLLDVLLDAAAAEPSAEAAALVRRLADAAERPYSRMLRLWLRAGVLHDPCGEFLVVAGGPRAELLSALDAAPTRGAAPAFALRPGAAPRRYARAAPAILHAGVFVRTLAELRVARPPPPPPGSPDADYVRDDAPPGEQDAAPPPPAAYVLRRLHDAGGRLRAHFWDASDVPGFFRAVGAVVLLLRPEWLAPFADAARPELRRMARHMDVAAVDAAYRAALAAALGHLDDDARRPPHLRALLAASAAARAPSSLLAEVARILDVRRRAADAEAEAAVSSASPLAAGGEPRPLEMAGFEMLQLDLRPPFPLSVLFSPREVAKYQLLFRRLFALVWLEELVRDAWGLLRELSRARDAVPFLKPAHALLFHVAQTARALREHFHGAAVWQEWRVLLDHLARPDATVPSLMATHARFLDGALSRCFLTELAAANALDRLLSVCQIACTYMDRFHRCVAPADLAARRGDRIVAALAKQGFEDVVPSLSSRLTAQRAAVQTELDRRAGRVLPESTFASFG